MYIIDIAISPPQKKERRSFMRFEIPVMECFSADILEDLINANSGSCSFSCGTYCSPVKG